MSSKIGVQNIAHTNGTNAMTVSASGVTTFTNTPVGTATNGPAFRAFRSSSLAQTSNKQTLMLYNSEQYDTNNVYNTSNGRFTPGVAGKYFVNMSVGIDGMGASNTLDLSLKINGTEWSRAFTNGNSIFQLASILTLDADDYVTAHFATNCASSVTVTGQAPKTWIEAFKLIGV